MKLLALAALLILPGCAYVKTRYAGDLALSCGRPLDAKDFCANFGASEALRRDPDVERTKVHCLGFYEEAIRSTQTLCSYFEEMDSLTEWEDGADSPKVSAMGKRIHRKYAELAVLRSRELERAYTVAGGRGVRGAVEELAYSGKRALAAELGCNPEPGRANGLLLLGVSAQARHDEKITYERLQEALRYLAGATSLVPPRPYLALREKFSIEEMRDPYDQAKSRISSSRLDETELLALGREQVPQSPELERYYAEAVQKAGTPPGTASSVRGLPTGRGLASVRCPR
jgi:hypothetical protein